MRLSARAALLLPTTLALCLLAACATSFAQQPARPAQKPRPPISVAEVKADPEPTEGAYRLQATIRNDTPGGPALVTFRLRDRASGLLFAVTGQVDLRPGEILVAVASLTAPPGDYEPEAVVTYPAR